MDMQSIVNQGWRDKQRLVVRLFMRKPEKLARSKNMILQK